MFPAIEPDDVATLTHAIDYVAEALRSTLIASDAGCDSILP